MDSPQIFIAISIIVLAIIAVLFFRVNKKKEKLTPLASFAFVFVLAGIIFGDDRSIGYGLMGVGVILAVIDIINKHSK